MSDNECQELVNAVVNYMYEQVRIRMLLYGEDFYTALANYLEEVENDDS